MTESLKEPVQASVRFPCACEDCSATDTPFEVACSCDSSRLPSVRNDRNVVGSNPSDDSFSPVQDSESTVFKDGVDFNTLASER